MSKCYASQLLLGTAVVAAGAAGSSSAFAAVFSWDGTGTGNNWTTAGNWSPDGAPPNNGSEDIRLPYTLTDSGKYLINVDSPQTINSLLFQNNGTANTYALSGATLTIDAGANPDAAILLQKGSVTATLNNNVILSRDTQQKIGSASGSTLQFGGTVTAPTSNNLLYFGNNNQTVEILTTGLLSVTNFTVQNTSNASSGTTTVSLKLDDATSLLDTMSLSLSDSTATTGTAKGYTKLNLSFIGTETIAGLVINGVTKVAGTYGATGSGADYIDDIHFAGTGMIYVPEPAAATLMLILGGSMVARRRRKV